MAYLLDSSQGGFEGVDTWERVGVVWNDSLTNENPWINMGQKSEVAISSQVGSVQWRSPIVPASDPIVFAIGSIWASIEWPAFSSSSPTLGGVYIEMWGDAGVVEEHTTLQPLINRAWVSPSMVVTTSPEGLYQARISYRMDHDPDTDPWIAGSLIYLDEFQMLSEEPTTPTTSGIPVRKRQLSSRQFTTRRGPQAAP